MQALLAKYLLLNLLLTHRCYRICHQFLIEFDPNLAIDSLLIHINQYIYILSRNLQHLHMITLHMIKNFS